VDGKPTFALQMRDGKHLYSVAQGLPPGEHTVRLVKATEAFCGVTQFLGFQVNQGGGLLPLPTPMRRIEVIGDSISCGYGNEADSKDEHFSPKTENVYFTYGAIAARQLAADYVCVAWSGKKMWPDNSIPEIYDRTLPQDAKSQWDFSQPKPDVVLINLATNDFGKSNPDEAGWMGAYKAFIARLRQHYPQAEIYCATSPMMGDWGVNKARTTVQGYLTRIVSDLNAAGDNKVHLIEFATQDAKNGIGADWHPSIKTHEIMANKMVATLRKDLGW
jgi:lysophospholipase L1-like esterase